MKTILYYKTDFDQVGKHNHPNILNISLLASNAGTSLYIIDSSIYNEDEIKEKLNWPQYPGEFINKVEAHVLGETLTKDRTTLDFETNEEVSDVLSLLDLDEAKTIKINIISSKTKELITSNFVYNSTTFGSTLDDQSNWNTPIGLKDKLTYPCNNIIKAITGKYIPVQDQAELENIVLTGMSAINVHRANHKTLVDQVNDCTEISEVNLIVDDR